MRSVLSLSVLSAAALLLTACLGDPLPLPRGYSANHDVYKSVPGPEARDVGYEYSNEKNQSVSDRVTPVAKDLVTKLDEVLSFSSDEIYLRMPRHTAFYNVFDHALRQEFIQSGYVLSNDKEHAVVVDFAALNADCADQLYIALALGVDEKMIPARFVGGFYDAPRYDFIPSETVSLVVPACGGTVITE